MFTAGTKGDGGLDDALEDVPEDALAHRSARTSGDGPGRDDLRSLPMRLWPSWIVIQRSSLLFREPRLSELVEPQDPASRNLLLPWELVDTGLGG